MMTNEQAERLRCEMIGPRSTESVTPMASAGRALRGIVAELAEDMSQPAARAGFCTSLLTSALLARRLGFLPTLAISLLAGVSVEHLYGMAEDIHARLTDAPEPV